MFSIGNHTWRLHLIGERAAPGRAQAAPPVHTAGQAPSALALPLLPRRSADGAAEPAGREELLLAKAHPIPHLQLQGIISCFKVVNSVRHQAGQVSTALAFALLSRQGSCLKCQSRTLDNRGFTTSCWP